MKKQKNATRIIAIVLVVLMALALIPIAASAEWITWTFGGNGGETAGGETSCNVSEVEGKITTPPANYFTREGCTFKNWYKVSGSIAGYVFAPTAVYAPTAEAGFIAQWTTTVSFDPGTPADGVAVSGTMAPVGPVDLTGNCDQNGDAIADYTVPASGYSATGYVFDHWQASGSDTGTYSPNSPNDTIELTGPVTLTACWEMDDPVDIYFDPNGGIGGPVTVRTPRAVALTVPTTRPTWSGHIFLGWADSETATTAQYTVGGTTPITPPAEENEKTVYAVWEPDTVPVTYNSGAGTVGSGTETNVAIPDGNVLRSSSFTVKSISALNIKEPSNTLFTHWTYNGTPYKAGDDYTVAAGDEDIVFTANYAAKCTVTYNSDGGTTYPNETVAAGTTIKLKDPTKEKYTFQGWYTNAARTDGPYAANSDYLIEANTTFYAKWQYDYIEVTFNAGGGGGTMEPDEAPRGGEYTLPANEFQPPQAEMAFVGWKIGSTEEIKQPTEKVSTVGYGDGLTLTAQWMDNAVTVTFDPNGGTATDGEKTQRMYRESASALSRLSTLSYTPPENKVFAGWSRTETGAVQFTDGENVQWNGSSGAKNYAETNAVTLYAKWQDNLAGSVAVTKGGAAVSSETTFKTGDTVTATATVTAPVPTPSPLYYKWVDTGSGTALASGQVDGTSVNYEVKAADLGKDVQVLFCTNNSFTDDNTISSAEFTLKPDASETVAVTVKVVGAAGNSAATVNGSRTADATTPEITINDIVKGADVTLALTADSAQQVKSVMKGTQALPLDRMTYTMQFTAATTVTVTFEAKGAHTNPRAVVNVSGAVPDAAKSAITTIAGSNPCCVYDVVPCWNGVISNPIAPGDIPAAVEPNGLSFTLPYPAGSGKVASTGKDISAKMDQYYKVRAWHWNGTAYDQIPATRVTGNALLASGITITGQKEFSPIAADLTPIPLAGTVVLKDSDGATVKDSAAVGKMLTASFTPSGPEVVGKLTYTWQYYDTATSSWKNLATGESYKPTADYRNTKLRCVAESDFETEPSSGWPYKEFKVSAVPEPKQKQYVVNFGDSNYSFAQAGVIGDLTSDMQYTRYPRDKKSDIEESDWVNVGTGKTESGGLSEGGTYWVRFKDDSAKDNWAPVTIDEYFTVTAAPDSVSTNRLYFTSSGSYTELIAGRVWLVPSGKSINVTANSANTNYYKITQLRTKNLETDNVTVRTINKANSGSTGSFTVKAPYYVSATAGVYGSKTGDTSHLELWVELAALSLMGLGAALVLGRRKLKAQK